MTMWRWGITCIFAARLLSQSFQGVIRDSATGLGIPRASILITSVVRDGMAYAGTTDAQGAFEFPGIKPGEYRVSVSRFGYVGADSTVQALKDRVFELDPYGAISGRVTGPQGEPASGAAVIAMGARWQRGILMYAVEGTAEAGEDGQYRLSLPPGRYSVSARPRQQPLIPMVYAESPGAAPVGIGAASKDSIELRPGQGINGVDLQMPAVMLRHVRGIAPANRVPVPMIRKRNGDPSPPLSWGGPQRKDGSFDYLVEPGSYWIETLPFWGPQGKLAVDVVDRDIDDVRLTGALPADLKGRVQFGDEALRALAPKMMVYLSALDWYESQGPSRAGIAADGSFTFPSVNPGEYVVALYAEGDMYLESITYNGRVAAGGRVDLSNGVSGELNLVVSSGMGEVSGSGQAGATAVLVSADGVTGNTGARSTEIDAAGRFQFQRVPPGRYYVFACARFDWDLWQNAEFVKRVAGRGAAVEVERKGSAWMEAMLLKAEEVERAVSALVAENRSLTVAARQRTGAPSAVSGGVALHGTVVDSENGKPLAETRIFAKPTAYRTVAILTTTDARGVFRFAALERGNYEIAAEHAGYLPGGYGVRPGGSHGSLVEVGESESPALKVRLFPAASIGGTALDSTGQPVEGGTVRLLRKVWENGWHPSTVGESKTDDRGRFHFPRLAPGTYYVRVQPAGGRVSGGRTWLDGRGQSLRDMDVPTFYGGGLTFERAVPIRLDAGQHADGILMTVIRAPLRRISGRISTAEPDGRIQLKCADESESGAPIQENGAFSAGGLPPLECTVYAQNAEVTVDLTSGDADGVVLEPRRDVTVQITARIEGATGPARVQLCLEDVERLAGPCDSGAGPLHLRVRRPGLYRVIASQAYFVKTLRVGGRDVPDAVLDLRGAAPADVDAVLSKNLARVDGRVARAEGETSSYDVTIVWFPVARPQAVGGSAPVGPSGEFGTDLIPPGKYRFFAIEGLDEELWGSTEVARALWERSVEIEVGEGERTRIQVPVTSFEAWKAVLRKAGF